MTTTKKTALSQGVRKLTIKDQAPDCEISINKPVYILSDLVKNKKVVDIGCGYGANKKLVESLGGEWVGVEPFEGGAHTVVADAQNLPFENNSFDVAIMDAVLEHIPEVEKAIAEVSRVLKPGGLFVGYAAFMECFHEISYSHLSFKALEHYAEINNMKLIKISGGTKFGIDYHLNVLFYPLPFKFMRRIIASCIRGIIKLKSKFVYLGLRYKRKQNKTEAKSYSDLFYKVECLRMSNGFSYVIQKL